MLNSGIARINDESLYVQVERMRKYLNEQKSAHEQSLKEMYAEVDSCKHKLEEANGKLEKEQTRRRKLQLELDSSIKTYNDLKLTQINSPVSASRQGRSFFLHPDESALVAAETAKKHAQEELSALEGTYENKCLEYDLLFQKHGKLVSAAGTLELENTQLHDMVTQLHEAVTQLTESNSKLSKEFQSLQEQHGLTELLANIHELEAQHAHFQQQHASVLKQLDQSVSLDDHRQVRVELEDLKVQITSKNSQLEQSVESFKRVQAELKEAQTKVNKMRERHVEVLSQVEEAHMSRTEMEQTVIKIYEKNQSLSDQVDELIKEKEELLAHAEQVKADAAKLATLDTKYNELWDEYHEITTLCETVTTQASEYRQTCAKLEFDVAVAKTEASGALAQEVEKYKKLAADFATVQAQLEEKTQMCENLSSKGDSSLASRLMRELAEKKLEIKKVLNQLETSKTELAHAESQIVELRHQHDVLSRHQEVHDERVDEKQHELTDTLERLFQLQNQHDKTVSELEDLQLELQDSKSKLLVAEAQLVELKRGVR